MRKTLIGLFSLLILHSCQNGPSQKEYDGLKSQLEQCSKENEELKNTPENRLLSAQNLETEGNSVLAESEYKALVEKFPKSDQAKIAQQFIDKVEKEREEKIKEEERKKRLGFKVLEQKTSIKQGDCKLKFSNIKLKSRWIFDRYGDKWRYIEAERGNKHLTFTLSITAESKSPNLPPIYVYQLIDGKLQFKATAFYKFHRWEDYASYLGNNADYGNDFARTETIRFSPGVQLAMDDFNKYPTFLMVKKSNCVLKNKDRFGNPPISYSNSACNYDQTLTADMATEDYFTIKIYNQDKI
ncbi:hypothetical protein N8Y96_02480 [Saprospiraceae bacterium]|nr:hypothetical protein [Saprospiraceae bacterium]